MNATITVLNHAALKIQIAGLSMLTDPWLWGTCFKDGWGLCTENPAALDEARSSDVLWISHFHGDHLHVPTLKELARLNPSMRVIANDSVNFSISAAMHRIGFRNVVSLAERVPLRVNEGLEVLRIPATGIDNMLVMRTPEGVVLNYNDCNLPYRAIRAVAAKIGPVDVLLNNYNIAAKVLEVPPPEPQAVKRRQLDPRRGVLQSSPAPGAAIATHSQTLFDWWSERYGTDGFVVGAHFRLVGRDLRALRLFLLAALLKENNLSLRDVGLMLLRPAGWRFFYCRREEIAAIILGWRMRTGVRQ